MSTENKSLLSRRQFLGLAAGEIAVLSGAEALVKLFAPSLEYYPLPENIRNLAEPAQLIKLYLSLQNNPKTMIDFRKKLNIGYFDGWKIKKDGQNDVASSFEIEMSVDLQSRAGDFLRRYLPPDTPPIIILDADSGHASSSLSIRGDGLNQVVPAEVVAGSVHMSPSLQDMLLSWRTDERKPINPKTKTRQILFKLLFQSDVKDFVTKNYSGMQADDMRFSRGINVVTDPSRGTVVISDNLDIIYQYPATPQNPPDTQTVTLLPLRRDDVFDRNGNLQSRGYTIDDGPMTSTEMLREIQQVFQDVNEMFK